MFFPSTELLFAEKLVGFWGTKGFTFASELIAPCRKDGLGSVTIGCLLNVSP